MFGAFSFLQDQLFKYYYNFVCFLRFHMSHFPDFKNNPRDCSFEGFSLN